MLLFKQLIVKHLQKMLTVKAIFIVLETKKIIHPYQPFIDKIDFRNLKININGIISYLYDQYVFLSWLHRDGPVALEKQQQRVFVEYFCSRLHTTIQFPGEPKTSSLQGQIEPLDKA